MDPIPKSTTLDQEHGFEQLPEAERRSFGAVAVLDCLDITPQPEPTPDTNLEAILGNYDSFSPDLSPLLAAIRDTSADSWDLETRIEAAYNDNEAPHLIARGTASEVYRLEKNASTYAVRVINRHDTFNDTVDGISAGKGVPGLEQIVAASPENNVTISEMMPGKPVNKLSSAEVDAIAIDQLERLFTTLEAASSRDIVFDFNAANYLYDPESGFGIVDYTHDQNAQEVQPLKTKVEAIARILSQIDTALPSIHSRADVDTYQASLDRRLSTLQNFKSICSEHDSSGELAFAVDVGSTALQNDRKRLEDPNYVNKLMSAPPPRPRSRA